MRQQSARYEKNEAALGALFATYIASNRSEVAEDDVLASVMDRVRHNVEYVYRNVFESDCDWQAHAEDKYLQVVDRVSYKLREGAFPSFASILAYMKQSALFYGPDAVRAKLKVNAQGKGLPFHDPETDIVTIEQAVPTLVPGGRRLTDQQIGILRSLPLRDQKTLTRWQMNDCCSETTATQMGLTIDTFKTKINRIKTAAKKLTLLRTAQTA